LFVVWLVQQLLDCNISVLWSDTDIVWKRDCLNDVLQLQLSGVQPNDILFCSYDKLDYWQREESKWRIYCNNNNNNNNRISDNNEKNNGNNNDNDDNEKKQNLDLIVQSDDDGLCAGFFLAHPTLYTRHYFNLLVDYLNPVICDQMSMRRFVDEIIRPGATVARRLNVLVLPRDRFPNGSAYFNVKLSQRRDVAVSMIHNNCIIGHDSKVQRFKDFGLWYCNDDVDNNNNNNNDNNDDNNNDEIFDIENQLKGHSELITSICCVTLDINQSSRIKVLASSSYDKTIRLWSLEVKLFYCHELVLTIGRLVRLEFQMFKYFICSQKRWNLGFESNKRTKCNNSFVCVCIVLIIF
jgi:hypothetical protein